MIRTYWYFDITYILRGFAPAADPGRKDGCRKRILPCKNIVTAPAGQSAATAIEEDGQVRTDTDAPRGTQYVKTTVPVYRYTCPFCAVAVASHVYTGQVDHRHACSNEFRVAVGAVSGRLHKHICPRCGTIVSSSQASGRIQVKHKTPSGRNCRQERWQT